MTLRQQLMMKRAIRNLRTWAPPISLGVIIGALGYFALEHFDPRADAQPQTTAVSYRSVAPPQRSAPEPVVQRAEQQLHVTEDEPRFVESYRASAPAFRNCAAARAAGADPVRAGEPGYAPHLDRDGDGIGCEPYRQ